MHIKGRFRIRRDLEDHLAYFEEINLVVELSEEAARITEFLREDVAREDLPEGEAIDELLRTYREAGLLEGE